MKKTTVFNKVIGTLLILFTFVSSLGGCSLPDDNGNNESPQTGVEGGFDNFDGCESSPHVVAFRASTNEFNIDSVKLTVYFGFYGSDSKSVEAYRKHVDYPGGFDFYVVNGDRKVLIRHENENFISEKYLINMLYYEENGEYKQDFKFNHSEEIVIPKDIFVSEKGMISLSLYGDNTAGTEHDGVIAGTFLYYKIVDDKVVIANLPFT